MKAIRMTRHGGPEVLEFAEIPIPIPGPDEVRIKQRFAGINYIDVYVRNGTYKRDTPLVLGREGVGTVDAIGSRVMDARVGQRIAYADTPALGGYAEYAIVPFQETVPVPDDVEDRIACALMLQGLTAHYLSRSVYPISPDDTVLVHAAAGGVGLLLTQLAKRAGATVIATAGGPEKAALARAAGADHVLDYRTVDFAPEVLQLTAGKGVEAVFDSVGIETYERSLSVVAVRGYLVLFGASSGPVPPIDPQRLSAAGSVYFTRPTLGDFKRTRAELLHRMNELFALSVDGALDVRIGATYPLVDSAIAHRDLEARRTTGKLLLEM